MINQDAKLETIEKYKNNLKNITSSLKMRGIDYRLIEGAILIKIGNANYTYSLTKRKWRKDVVVTSTGLGVTDLLADIDGEVA